MLPTAAFAQVIYGDVNGDLEVNIADVNAVIDVILSDVNNPSADVNGDGEINIADINAVTEVILTPPPFTETFTVGGVSFQMVAVEGGTFTMGSKYSMQNFHPWYPTHEVTLSSYSIGKTEVTQELWTAVMGVNPSYYSSDKEWVEYGGNSLYRPVECVSWNDCQEFIARLNMLTGREFRLPTEAEWEFAARGGNRSHGYSWSGSNNFEAISWNCLNCAWYDDEDHGPFWTGYTGTRPVATLPPNELGLYDMSGNVWELVNDWYGSYSSDAQINPTGPESGTSRVERGGSIEQTSSFIILTVWYRKSINPTTASSIVGFRLAL